MSVYQANCQLCHQANLGGQLPEVPSLLGIVGKIGADRIRAVVKDGQESLGNKTGYQHHGAWFARHGYVCLATAHGLTEARRDPALRRIYNESWLTTPDGMPLVWLGPRGVGRVYGPDLMLAVCDAGRANGLRHYLCGGAPGVAEELRILLCERFKGLEVAGTWCPPFHPMTAEERSALIADVARARPDVMWIGISSPKQERLMAELWRGLDAGVLIGVATDAMTPAAFGAGALAMTLVGFTASWLKSVFFSEHLALNATFVCAGKWAFDLVYVLAERRIGGVDLVAQLLWWSPLSAALTALVGLAVIVASRPPSRGRHR